MPDTTTTTIQRPPATDQMTQVLKGVMPLIPFLFQAREEQRAQAQAKQEAIKMDMLQKEHALRLQNDKLDKNLKLFKAAPPMHRAKLARSWSAAAYSHGEPNMANFYDSMANMTEAQIEGMDKLQKKLSKFSTEGGTLEDLQALKMEAAVEYGEDMAGMFDKFFESYQTLLKPPTDIETWVNPQTKQTMNLPKGRIPPAGPWVKASDMKKGTHFEIDPSTGAVTFSQGGSAFGADLTTPVKTDVQKKRLGAQELLTRIQGIRSDYDPKYLNVQGRINNALQAFQEKWGGEITPEARKELAGLTTFLRSTMENLNMYIKDMTGAQMSAQEAVRLSFAMPKPGEDWWDFLWKGDSATQFEAKLDSIEKYTKAAIARYTYYLNQNKSPEEIRRLINTNMAVSLDEIVSRMQ